MDRDTEHFTRRLLLIFGPLWIAGGFLAAFTLVGAVFVFLGIAMLVTSALMYGPAPWWLATVVGLVVFSVLTAWTMVELFA